MSSPHTSPSCLLTIVFLASAAVAMDTPKLIVETDIGGDRDDQESFIRLLLHSNELDIRTIVCDRPEDQLLEKADDNAQNPDRAIATNGVNMALYYIDRGYAPVAANLKLHDPAFPSADQVRNWLVSGEPGIIDGRDRIIREIDAMAEGEIVWYMNWGSNVVQALPGETTIESNFKLALDHVREKRGDEGLKKFLTRVRIISLDGNSNRHGRLNTRLGDELNAFVRDESMHIEAGWPTLDGGRWYHRFQPITMKAGGFDKFLDLSDDHGPLAKLYRELGQKEGDSWCFVYLLPFGISDPLEPTWGGLAGRYAPRQELPGGTPESARGAPFYWNDQSDTWNGTTHRDHTAARFAAALQNSFRARMDWCVMSFEQANHDPVPSVTVNGGIPVAIGVRRIAVAAGSTINLSASVTDPDPDDSHLLHWIHYPEAGNYRGDLEIRAPRSSEASVVIPTDANGKQIHIYLEATDDGSRKGNRIPDLTRYCRVVINVNP